MRSKVFHLLCSCIDSRPSLFIDKLASWKGDGPYVSFVNPLSVGIANNNECYLNNLKSMDFVFSDGVLLCKAASYIMDCQIERASFDGNSLAPDVFTLLSKNKTKVAFIGGEGSIAGKAAETIANKYGVDIAYSRNGFFGGDEFLTILSELTKHDIGFVLVGMGAPHQERMMRLLKDSNWIGGVISCGGYLDQVVKNGEKYYPDWVNDMNLRALYRMFKEPKRLVPRYTLHYSPFYISFLKEIFTNEK
jgi:exopolysaccharide biosynthesis WecB/TagA/CpsF family protein